MTAFKRDFTEDIRVCDELELILVHFEKEMETNGVEPLVRLWFLAWMLFIWHELFLTRKLRASMNTCDSAIATDPTLI